METLTANPLFQSGLLPFGIALVTAFVLRPLGWFWSGLGFALAYATAIYFIVGFQFTPLTSTRKIILLGGTAVLMGLLIDALPKKYSSYLPWFIAFFAVVAGIWLVWPVLKRLEGQEYWIMFSATAAYSAWLMTWTESLREQSARASSTAFALGLGISISSVLGASALLGQLGGTMAAAAGAYLLLLILNRSVSLGSSFCFPVAIFSALIGLSAVTYSGLTWYSLMPLALIPLAARLPVKENWHPSLKTIITVLYPLPLAAISIYITWQLDSSGDSLY